MPTYDYSGEVTKKFAKVLVAPGERFEVPDYLSDTDVTLVSDLPAVDAQTEEFFGDDIVAGTVSEVTINPSFPRVTLNNTSGGVCRVYPNDDTDKAIAIADDGSWEFDNREHKIGKLNLSGEASGRVEVIGDMNTI